METGIDGLQFKNETENINQENKTNNFSNWLSITLEVFSWLELLVGILLGIVFGIDNSILHVELNAAIFFSCLAGGVVGFVIFQALAVCVKAANKYLNH